MRCNYKLPLTIYCFAILLFCGVICLSKSVMYNITNSEQIGWYWVGMHRYGIENIQVGKLYTIKLPDTFMRVIRQLGYRANSYTLLKRVVARSGDIIEVDKAGVFVNRKLINNSQSKQMVRGIELHPLPIGYKYILHNGEYFVMGETDSSFDSRYFGVMNKDNFISEAYLIMKGWQK
ncbi:MAG: S26 family signal peptidase [Burkholderiales bacterium]|nr:S26 family signal peptidase [Burkholderiales bacterium]